MKLLRVPLLALAALCALASVLGAAQFVGPNKCSSCHDHEKQKAWADQDKHAKALAQLEDKNAGKYAKAIGLADPYDLKGACVKCHATVFNGDANAGVSCETCHGAGSDYVEPHQQKGSYAKAITQGMFDTRGNYPVWAKMCLDCHIMRDAKLVAAGHKSGADFEVGAASQKIVHWAPTYDFSRLTALGKGAAGKAGGGPAPAPKQAPAPTKPVATAPPAAGKPTAPPKPASPEAAPARPSQRPVEPVRPTAPATAAPSRPAPASPAPTRAAAATPEKRQTPAPEKTWTPVTREGITIQIRATPIPTVTPIVAAAPVREKRMMEAPPAQGRPNPPPARRPAPARRPRPKRPPAAVSPPPPAPTPTATKLPAPQEPPRRPPH